MMWVGVAFAVGVGVGWGLYEWRVWRAVRRVEEAFFGSRRDIDPDSARQVREQSRMAYEQNRAAAESAAHSMRAYLERNRDWN